MIHEKEILNSRAIENIFGAHEFQRSNFLFGKEI